VNASFEGGRKCLDEERKLAFKGDDRALSAPLITLLTDFGLKDPYVAEMKAVILTICPEARIVDISHTIEKFNVRMGAFVLSSAVGYFPEGTVHIGVVDPSVGTRRRAVLVETKLAFYVGPDNGLLMLAARREEIRHVYSITNPKLMLPRVSSTFHGRDVFAPAAAHLANGTSLRHFGSEIKDYVMPDFAAPLLQTEKVVGEILHIDDFGNIITNVMGAELEKAGFKTGETLSIRLKSKSFGASLCEAYGDVAPKTSLALIGSHDFLEIAVNQGNAAKTFNVKTGDSVVISPAKR
jgi:S-adenosylmethionine hydrolase